MRVSFTVEALEELSAAVVWYEARQTGLGNRLIATIDVLVHTLAEAPSGFPVVAEHGASPVRRLLLSTFPYCLLFRIVGDDVEVLAFAHLRRCPGYWKERP